MLAKACQLQRHPAKDFEVQKLWDEFSPSLLLVYALLW